MFTNDQMTRRKFFFVVAWKAVDDSKMSDTVRKVRSIELKEEKKGKKRGKFVKNCRCSRFVDFFKLEWNLIVKRSRQE